MNNEGADYTCNVCGLPFDSEEELEEHMEVAHGGEAETGGTMA